MLLKSRSAYMPPECIDIGLISSKYDIYSLGVTIIQMITGRRTGTRWLREEFADLVRKLYAFVAFVLQSARNAPISFLLSAENFAGKSNMGEKASRNTDIFVIRNSNLTSKEMC